MKTSLPQPSETPKAPRMKKPTRVNSVPATNFVSTMAANVDNAEMSDAAFRQFVRNTLPIVDYGAK